MRLIGTVDRVRRCLLRHEIENLLYDGAVRARDLAVEAQGPFVFVPPRGQVTLADLAFGVGALQPSTVTDDRFEVGVRASRRQIHPVRLVFARRDGCEESEFVPRENSGLECVEDSW